MPEFILHMFGTFQYVFAIVTLLGGVIAVHEFGHFIFAKWAGIRAAFADFVKLVENAARGVARALAARPEIVLMDEPFGALDPLIRTEMQDVLVKLQADLKKTILFITHDLSVAYVFSDRIGIMYLGKIVELGPTEEVIKGPMHPYTKALLSANPRMDSADTQERIVLKGDIPNPINRPTGCSFHPRCPLAQEKCRSEEPQLLQISSGAQVACHFAS